jgi:hypothetical protein
VSVIEGKGFIRVACCVYKFLCSQHNAAKNGGKAVFFLFLFLSAEANPTKNLQAKPVAANVQFLMKK